MKRFLEKANRGLILGACALILLVIYIVVDYSGFSDEQPKIKEAVENYIGEFYKRLSEDNYSGLCQLVEDTWTEEPVVMVSYYDDKETLSQFFEIEKNKEHNTEYGDITYELDKMSVSKAGPGMAKVTFTYVANIEYGADGNYLCPFISYYTGWYDSEKSDKRYVYESRYECQVYLRKDNGKWSIAQAEGWHQDCIRNEKEGE